MSLAVQGLKWNTLSQLGRQTLQWSTTLVLARVLSPDDFGAASIAFVVTGFTSLFKDLGIGTAIIREKELDPPLLNSLFWVSAGFGILLCAMLWCSAPVIGAFFHQPRLARMLQVLSAAFLISGLSVVPQALLERKLAFSELARIELAATLLAAIVAVAMAWAGRGVWSLVAQNVCLTVASTAGIIWAANWRPAIAFNGARLKGVAGFGANLVAFNIWNYLSRNIDNLLIGKFLGTADLGVYALAYKVMLYPIQNISGVVGRVLYPRLAMMQGDDGKIRNLYLRINYGIALIAFPLMAGMFIAATPLVQLFFGSKWAALPMLIRILAPVGLIQSVATTVGSLYQIKNRTDLLFYWGVGSSLMILLGFLVGLHWGVIGMAAAYAAVNLLLVYPNFAVPFRLIGMKTGDLFRHLAAPMLSSGLMLVVLVPVARWLPRTGTEALSLTAIFLVGTGCYCIVSWMTSKQRIHEVIRTLRGR